MADNSREPPVTRTIAGFEAACVPLGADTEHLRVWTVADLERHVDRDALLRGDDPAEPPYWAMCWSGARVLAARVPARAGRVVEVGCGLGIPGAVAARRGARVVFVDRVAESLAFVRATLRTNRLEAAGVLVADVLQSPWRNPFDLVLAAELLYDRQTFAAMASALAAALAPGGRILLADAHRIDTAAFYDAASAAGLVWTREDVRIAEEGFPLTVSIVEMRRL
jgi:predicted nicotinamide N-methyase